VEVVGGFEEVNVIDIVVLDVEVLVEELFGDMVEVDGCVDEML